MTFDVRRNVSEPESATWLAIGLLVLALVRGMQLYRTEFDFCYNNRAALGVDDQQRTANALETIEGKRLTYQRTH